MSFPCDRGPGISNESIEYSDFMHIQGGILYVINITGHVLRDILMVRNGLNPSLANPSLTLRESSAKSGCNLSKSIHAWPSAGWLNFPSFECSSSCHLKESSVFEHINNLLSLGINGKCLKFFAETRCEFLEGSTSPSTSGFSIYREAPQV